MNQRDNFVVIAQTSGVTVNGVDSWIIGRILSSIPAPYWYTNVHHLVKSLKSSYQQEALRVIDSLDSEGLFHLDRTMLRTYGVMDSTDNIVIHIDPKMQEIMHGIFG